MVVGIHRLYSTYIDIHPNTNRAWFYRTRFYRVGFIELVLQSEFYRVGFSESKYCLSWDRTLISLSGIVRCFYSMIKLIYLLIQILIAVSLLNCIYNNAKGIQEGVLLVLANVRWGYWFFYCCVFMQKSRFLKKKCCFRRINKQVIDKMKNN